MGIGAARTGIEIDPKSAAAHYYLGLNLGELAQTRSLGALKLLSQMEAAWNRSLELDAQLDFAGAHRSLGMLYRDAPGWPASIGDRSKARRHLEQAVALCPGYPDNQLVLLEAWLKWGEKKSFATRIPEVEKILETARRALTGPAWASAWKDWDLRWEKIKSKATVQGAKSPRMSAESGPRR